MARSRRGRDYPVGMREEERKRRGPRRFSQASKKRLLFVFFLVMTVLALLIGRLIWLSIKEGQTYQRNVMSIMSGDGRTIPFRRGDILDRSGTTLASSERIYTLILAPKTVTDGRSAEKIRKAKSLIEEAAALYFEVSRDVIEDAFQENPESYYVVLKKEITYEEKEKYDEYYESYLKSLEEAKQKGEDPENLIVNGIWFEESYKRKYPFGTLACGVIGFLNGEEVGVQGLEKYYNDRLSGTDGRSYALIDEDTNSRNVVKEPVNGCRLVTTIDINLQRIAEKYIDQFQLIKGADHIGVLMMDPNEGTILAMAGSPAFDLNDPYDLSKAGYSKEQLSEMSTSEQSAALDALWKNFCVNTSYEPGSTAKTMTVAYALDEDIAADDDRFECYGGLTHDTGTTVTCNSYHGQINLKESIMYSCNVAMMEIADRIGVEDFVKCQRMFGIGQLTGIDLDGEMDCASLVFDEENMGPIELWTSSFGQGFNVTMIQMASAFSSIINGGNYYQPHVVSEIQNDSGNTLELIDKKLIRKTVSRQTSDWMKEALYETVQSGTGMPAKVPGYQIGGKTGTAEVGKRGSDDRLVSFIGAAPIHDPQLVVYVVIDRPHDEKDQGQSEFASKMAGKIFHESLQYLQIFPTEMIEEDEQEQFEKTLRKDEENAQKAARGEPIEEEEEPEEGEGEEPSYDEGGADGSYSEENYNENYDENYNEDYNEDYNENYDGNNEENYNEYYDENGGENYDGEDNY